MGSSEPSLVPVTARPRSANREENTCFSARTRSSCLHSSEPHATTHSLNGDFCRMSSTGTVGRLMSLFPLSNLRVGFSSFGSSSVNWQTMTLSRPFPSFTTAMNSGYTSSGIGRNAWKALVGPDASLQPYCNLEGINAIPSGYTNVRLGISSNEQNDCNSCDSGIGFGISGGTATISVGDYAPCCSTDNGQKQIAFFGYILGA